MTIFMQDIMLKEKHMSIYYINRYVVQPLDRNYLYHSKYDLDVEAMKEACKILYWNS